MSTVYHTTIQDHGRVVIPAPVRTALGLARGDEVVLRVENHAVVISGVPDAVKRFQAAVRRHVPAGPSLADELLADRRKTAVDE
ncbi:MAG TPA: AbrB/MazE/SpoVT family DNA-binding domain-containing protein [Urbifossiella sp.]|jgi:AbrB family looped-hinge helix DNA binding protein|nr:AbrB/MazE/SpoVT family DNA-binding domain-containing protein [Urbifossiella sp.]